MTIENLLLSVCEAMTPELTDEQLTSLKDILFMKFRGIEIREECTAVQTAIGAEEERLQDLKALMGHSKIDTTMIYCDVKEENVSMSYRRYGEIA